MVERLKDGEWIDSYHKDGKLVDAVPEDLGVYVLPEYEFGYTFDVEPFGDPGSAANIEPKAGGTVYGAVYKISENQLRILDETEDEPVAYIRTALKVYRYVVPGCCQRSEENSAPEEITAWVYVGNKKYHTHEKSPDVSYVQLLVEAAKMRSLPSEYIHEFLTKVYDQEGVLQ